MKLKERTLRQASQPSHLSLTPAGSLSIQLCQEHRHTHTLTVYTDKQGAGAKQEKSWTVCPDTNYKSVEVMTSVLLFMDNVTVCTSRAKALLMTPGWKTQFSSIFFS